MNQTAVQKEESGERGLAWDAVKYLTCTRPFQVMVDGLKVVVPPCHDSSVRPENILLVPALSAAQILEQPGSKEVRVYKEIKLPRDFTVPRVYDGDCQGLAGKKVLVLTFNGWGDIILVQPVFRLFFEKIAGFGDPPEITVAGSWVNSFPYKEESFISSVVPNHITLDEVRRFDWVVNLFSANRRRRMGRSMRGLYLEALGLLQHERDLPAPVIKPDKERVQRLRPLLEGIRQKTGRKLLYLNWRSRFAHKSAPQRLFFETARMLKETYHFVLFKDQAESAVMGRQIKEHGAPVEDLSGWIRGFPDSVAAVSLMDAVISVDTGIVHAAGALGIPCVAVFGPFSPEGHVDAYSSVKGIRSGYQGNTCKGPCEETHRGCREVGFNNHMASPCIMALTPRTIASALKDLE